MALLARLNHWLRGWGCCSFFVPQDDMRSAQRCVGGAIQTLRQLPTRARSSEETSMRRYYFAIIVIAFSAVCTGAGAETIYKCGTSYSQQPCAAAAALNLADERTPAQKAQADEATRRDRQLADSLRKERLTDEKLALAAQRESAKKDATSKTVTPPAQPKARVVTIKTKPVKISKPTAVAAKVPTSEAKAAVKKAATTKASKD